MNIFLVQVNVEIVCRLGYQLINQPCNRNWHLDIARILTNTQVFVKWWGEHRVNTGVIMLDHIPRSCHFTRAKIFNGHVVLISWTTLLESVAR
jgi:hypothetical protein